VIQALIEGGASLSAKTSKNELPTELTKDPSILALLTSAQAQLAAIQSAKAAGAAPVSDEGAGGEEDDDDDGKGSAGKRPVDEGSKGDGEGGGVETTGKPEAHEKGAVRASKKQKIALSFADEEDEAVI
jgi:hypothetical protein